MHSTRRRCGATRPHSRNCLRAKPASAVCTTCGGDSSRGYTGGSSTRRTKQQLKRRSRDTHSARVDRNRLRRGPCPALRVEFVSLPRVAGVARTHPPTPSLQGGGERNSEE